MKTARSAASLALAMALSLSLSLASCGGGGGGGGAAPNGDGGSNIATGQAQITGTVQPDPASPTSASGKNSGATVYVVGQQDKATTTDADGNFTLTVDATLTGKVLSSPKGLLASLFRSAGDVKQFGLVILSTQSTHGRKTEINVTEGLANPLDTIYINTVGSITGKAFLQGQTDHTGIRVYIPGTSFQATTDQNGNYTMTGVPSGTYDIVRADYPGTVYHYAAVAKVTVTSNQATTLPDMYLLTSVGPSGMVIINRGAAYSTSKTVELQIAPSDNAVLMQISDDINFTGLLWEDVKATKTFTFSGDFSNGGTATVYVKFADMSALASSPVSAQIYIDTNPLSTVVSPVNGGKSATTKPTLDWNYAAAMPSPTYHVRIGAANDCSTAPIEQATSLTSSQYTLTTALTNGITYYWCAAIIDAAGNEWNWSGPWSFTVDLGTVDLVSPSNTTITNNTTPAFSWSANANAVSYTLAVQGPTTTSIVTTQTTYTLTSALVTEGTYTWTVTPVDQFGKSGSTSGAFSFILDTTRPAAGPISTPTGTVNGITINSNDILAASSPFTISMAATDANKVVAYYLSLTSAPPGASDWIPVGATVSLATTTSISAPASSGTVTAYVWYKDQAGNVSATPASDSINYVKFASEAIHTGSTSTTQYGGSTSIALNHQTPNLVHISYLNYGNKSLLYRSGSLGSWPTSTIVDTLASGNDGVLSMALGSGPTGTVHISYYNSANATLRYAACNPVTTNCSTTVLDSTEFVGNQNSIAVDANGKVHVNYSAGNSINYALLSSGTWTIRQNITGSLPIVDTLATAVSSTGTPHVVYGFDNSSNTVNEAVFSSLSSAWPASVINPSGTTQLDTDVDIALDANNKSHVCYVSAYMLYYSTNASGSWITAQVAPESTVVSCAIAVDAANKAHIAYGTGSIKYATNKSGTWANAVVVSGSNEYYRPDIVVDTDDTIHMSYTHRWDVSTVTYSSLNYSVSQ